MTLRESNPDVYVTGSDEIRVFYHPLTSQNSASLLGVGSAPATTVRENQSEVDGRTHTTNTPRQDTHGQHWTRAMAMSAHFFTSLNPCFKESGTCDGVGKQGSEPRKAQEQRFFAVVFARRRRLVGRFRTAFGGLSGGFLPSGEVIREVTRGFFVSRACGCSTSPQYLPQRKAARNSS